MRDVRGGCGVEYCRLDWVMTCEEVEQEWCFAFHRI